MWLFIIANIWVETDFCADVHKYQGKKVEAITTHIY